MTSSTAESSLSLTTKFRSPKTVIARFIARRNFRSSGLWALAFGLYVASKAIGFVKAYPTDAAREKAAHLFSNNIGVEVLLGSIRHAGTTAGYVAWNCFMVMVIIGSIWGFLLATKTLRGEEDMGRWELLLTGQTTARKAVLNTFAGFAAILAVFYIVSSAAFTLIGRTHGVDFSFQAANFLSLGVVSGIAIFMMLGALTSQLMSTRSRAAAVCAVVFAIFYLTRTIGDITSATWALNLTPLGWLEKLQPLADSQPLWLIPIFGLIFVLAGLAIYFAGKRDLGESTFPDKPSAKPHTKLLNSPFSSTIRFIRSNTIGWFIGFFLSALLYGLISNSGSQAFNQTGGAHRLLASLSKSHGAPTTLLFLGLVFFLQMLVIMSYSASAVVAIRKEEADGQLDNILVGPYSRLKWLSGRVLIVGTVLVMAGFLTMIGIWIGVNSQHIGISLHPILMASMNMLIPVSLTLSIGILAFGIRPRLTSLIAYGAVAWSFLIAMISSGLKLNHWIVDTSILNHIVFAPAANPNWHTNYIILIISAVLCLLGVWAFVNRDLQSE